MTFPVFLSYGVNESFWVLVLVFSAGIQIFFWLFIFNKLDRKSSTHQGSFLKPMTIVICARNALHLLKKNLDSFLSQDYPDFELVLVDDSSDDGTEKWVEGLRQNYPKLIYYRNIKTMEGKKQALSLGISKAKNDWIALSDADCIPASPYWLKNMVSNAGQSTQIVLGYAPYKNEGGFLNRFIRFETCLNAIQYLSAAKNGFPYMGTGRNLLYHKSIFNQDLLKTELPYGDDDFLMNATATKLNTQICIPPDAFVYSVPASTYNSYFNQRWRHYAAAKNYKLDTRLLLFIYFLSYIAMYTSMFVLLFVGSFQIAGLTFGLYLIISWIVFCKKCRLLKEEGLCLLYPILNLMYLVHIILQIPFLWIKKRSW